MTKTRRIGGAGPAPEPGWPERLFAVPLRGPTLFARRGDGTIAWSHSGLEQVLIYRLIGECGVQPGEIPLLTAACFELASSPSYLVLGSLHPPGRRGCRLPLPRMLASVPGEHLIDLDPALPLFAIGPSDLDRLICFDAGAAGLGSSLNAMSLVASFAARMMREGSAGGIWGDGAVEVRP
jgi:hypothetical protein